MSLPFEDGLEAREWLATNQNASALASNRFGPTSDAREFVERLYALGVRRVFVPGNGLRDETEKEGGFYADILVTEIGPSTDRAALLTLFTAEHEHEGFGDPGGLPLYDDRYLLFWWD